MHKKAYLGFKEKAEILATMRGINDPLLEPRRYTASVGRAEKEMGRKMTEMRQAPGRDLIVMVLEEADRVLKVSQGSKNLKGTFVKSLNETYVALRSAAGVLAERGSASSGGAPDENREEVEVLRIELQKKRREKETIRREKDLMKRMREMEGRLSRLEGGYIPSGACWAASPPSPPEEIEKKEIEKKKREG